MLTYLMCVVACCLGYFLGHCNGYNKGVKDEYLGNVEKDKQYGDKDQEG